MDDTFVYKAQQLTFDGNGAWQTYQSRSSLNASSIVQAILDLVPSLLFFIAAAFRILALKPRPNVARPGWLLAAKLVTCAALLCLQTSLVALLFLTAASSPAAVATAAARLTGGCTLLALSYLEHRRTINPSIIIGAFLWTTVILDLARATTLLPLRQSGLGDGLPAPVFAAVQAVQLLLLILEDVPKQGCYLSEAADGQMNLPVALSAAASSGGSATSSSKATRALCGPKTSVPLTINSRLERSSTD